MRNNKYINDYWRRQEEAIEMKSIRKTVKKIKHIAKI